MQKFLFFVFAAIIAATEIGLCQVVQTRLGPVQGRRESRDGRNYLILIAIPYAEPPIGPLRFQDTRPKIPWGPPTVLYANGNFSKKCPQGRSFVAASQSEDCLYLNIFAPENASRLPVMMYIHGGGLQAGSASDRVSGVDGILKNFVSHDVIVVSINYRLGALGFWNLHSPTASGNFGFLDEVTALQWIKDNIENFGGDQNKITVFGGSAGAISTSMLTLSPLSQSEAHHKQ